MSKLKFAVLLVLVVTGVVVLVVFRAQLEARMREKNETLRQQAQRIAELEAQNERLSNFVFHAGSTVPTEGEPSRELLRLRGEIGVLREQTNDLGGLREENTRLSQALAESGTNQLPPEDQVIMRQTHAVDAMTTLLQAIKSYATNHNGQYPGNLDELIAAGQLGATNLVGNLRLNDFQFGPGAGVDPQGNPVILRLRVPIPKPGGGGVMVVGGINGAGVPHTAVWNVGP